MASDRECHGFPTDFWFFYINNLIALNFLTILQFFLHQFRKNLEMDEVAAQPPTHALVSDQNFLKKNQELSLSIAT